MQNDGIIDAPFLDNGGAEFPVVCIGMSAGAMEPVQALFRGVSSRTGMAFVVINHLRSGHTSHLPLILSRCTSMPAHVVKPGVRFEPNHVYVISPGQELGVTDGLFTSQPRTKEYGWANVISLFLDSLSRSRHLGIAVILSGMDEDGAKALKAFKRHGGVVIVQAPDTASSRGMPTAAINTGAVDHVLSPDQIPGQLEKIAQDLNCAA